MNWTIYLIIGMAVLILNVICSSILYGKQIVYAMKCSPIVFFVTNLICGSFVVIAWPLDLIWQAFCILKRPDILDNYNDFMESYLDDEDEET